MGGSTPTSDALHGQLVIALGCFLQTSSRPLPFSLVVFFLRESTLLPFGSQSPGFQGSISPHPSLSSSTGLGTQEVTHPKTQHKIRGQKDYLVILYGWISASCRELFILPESKDPGGKGCPTCHSISLPGPLLFGGGLLQQSVWKLPG